jgi:maltooligosyltrehalose trehalohydrolase
MPDMTFPLATPRVHKMRFGAEVTKYGTRFKIWAPKCKEIALKLKGRRLPIPLERQDDGWHRKEVEGVGAGAQYRFVLPDGTEIADPASRHQPGDIDGYSEVIDPAAYTWRDAVWRGRPWEEAIIYEMHVGTFTPEGTFAAAAQRLDHLQRLGITAIQLMPLADSYGKFNWGYDGVLWFAPASQYGRPEDLKALVDAAHQRSIMVFIDVVYNHFGAVRNMLPLIAPIFTAAHKSPWGDAINFDGKQADVVREFVIESALYWMTEFNLDGLRFDAVHAITDESTSHILEILAARILAARRHRHTHLIVENSENHEIWLKRDTNLHPVHFTAQWNDDLHHLLHAAVTGENTGYYKDFDNLAPRCDMLGRALSEGFAYQGEMKPQEGIIRGEPSSGLPPTAFVSYMQNHDQIGNRIKGNRICTIASEDAVLAMASVYLLAPQIPMLFMGEEWGAEEPFPFFSDLPEALRDSTRKGRIEELKKTPEHEDPNKLPVEEAVDPTDIATFRSAKLDWSVLRTKDAGNRLHFYRNLIDVRHREISPRLARLGGFSSTHETLGDNAVLVTWHLGDGSTLRLYLNLCGEAQDRVPGIVGRKIWLHGFTANDKLGPWTVIWTVEV